MNDRELKLAEEKVAKGLKLKAICDNLHSIELRLETPHFEAKKDDEFDGHYPKRSSTKTEEEVIIAILDYESTRQTVVLDGDDGLLGFRSIMLDAVRKCLDMARSAYEEL